MLGVVGVGGDRADAVGDGDESACLVTEFADPGGDLAMHVAAWATISRTVWRTKDTIPPASSMALEADAAAVEAVVNSPVVVAACVL